MPSRPNLLPREINLTPLVDLGLVLLILLVVVVPLLRREPPSPPAQASAQALHGRLDQIAVAIAVDGAVFIEQRQVTQEELTDLLVALHDAGPNRPVLVQGDRRLRYRQVCELMEEINRAGFRQVSLIMQPAAG